MTTEVETATETQQQTETHDVVLQKPKTHEKLRKDYKPPEYYIKHADLNVSLDETNTKVESVLHCYRATGTPAGTDFVLHGDELCLQEVVLNGETLKGGSTMLSGDVDWSLDADGNLSISASKLPTNAEETFKITTTVTINPEKNLKLMGFFKSGSVLCTQCEPEGFRRITYFVDRPDNMSTYRVRLSGDKTKFPVLLCNGNKTERGDLDNNCHYAIFDDPVPKPSYLFAIVAGKLYCLTEDYTHSKNPSTPIKVCIWSDEEDLEKLKYSMYSIKKAMEWDEDTFGLKYDLDVFNIVCVRDFNMGAMENKGLNVFVSSLILASPTMSTDADYLRIIRVVGHEYFHNWTGNRVTCRDWFQLTLKEGLTVFRDQQFSMDIGSPAVRRIEDVVALRASQFAEDMGPMSHPIRPESYISMDNFYTATVYEKGAEVVRMYQTILGRDGFKKGMDLYFKRHDGDCVTCDDFRSAMATANKVDFTQFERWYTQAGTPILRVTSKHYDPKTEKYTFCLEQTCPPTAKQPTKLPFHMPVLAGLISKDSKKEIKPTTLFEMKKSTEEFCFTGVKEEPFLSILRDYCAPVKLEMDQTEEECAFQMAYDTDSFCRWDAGQKLTKTLLIKWANEITKGTSTTDLKLPETIVNAFDKILKEENLDSYFKSLMFVLPTEEYLSQEIPHCDPTAITNAIKTLKKSMKSCLGTCMQKTYDDLQTISKKPYEIFPIDTNVGPRQLRNILLSYLCSDRTPEAAKTAYEHFKTSTNMNDKMASFRCLCNIPSDEKTKAITEFYESSKGNELMVDKWFSVQAGADTPTQYDDVVKLLNHPEFSLKIPSRMRAVIARFAYNFCHFHDASGKGYKLVADKIIELDTFNTTVAARLATTLIGWDRFETKRQELMKAELKRISECPNISSETAEIVNKGLTLH